MGVPLLPKGHPDCRSVKDVSSKHPLLARLPQGVWFPQLVGLVYGYPTTQEAFDAVQRVGKRTIHINYASGAFDGRSLPGPWRGQRRLFNQALEIGAQRAKRVMEIMRNDNLIDGGDPRGEQAIEAALQVVTSEITDVETGERRFAYGVKERLAAMRLVADFCKAKPVSKTHVEVKTAEDYLDALVGKASDAA